MEIIQKAIQEGQSALSEFDSKQVLAAYKIPITKEVMIKDSSELDKAVKEVGYPLVMKGCSAEIAHKTEKGLIQVDLRNEDESKAAFEDISNKLESDGDSVLVQEMVKGQRELVVGMTRDPQFGPCVMFGLGGIFTEVFDDVVFRAAPLSIEEAKDQIFSIRSKKILGNIRGMEEVDIDTLSKILVSVGKIGLENENIKEIDINPLKIKNSQPVAVDALVVNESERNHS